MMMEHKKIEGYIKQAPALTFSLLILSFNFIFYFILTQELINELFMCIFHQFIWEVQKAHCIIHQFQFSFNNFHFYSNCFQSTLSHNRIVTRDICLVVSFMWFAIIILNNYQIGDRILIIIKREYKRTNERFQDFIKFCNNFSFGLARNGAKPEKMCS